MWSAPKEITFTRYKRMKKLLMPIKWDFPEFKGKIFFLFHLKKISEFLIFEYIKLFFSFFILTLIFLEIWMNYVTVI